MKILDQVYKSGVDNLDDQVILNVEDVSVAFNTEAGKVHAVDHVRFELKKGIILGLVGESGCGKSVTALSIMRLLPKPSGQIINGKITFNTDNSDDD